MANILHRPGVDPVPCHLLVVFATDSLRKEVYLPRRFAARPVSSNLPITSMQCASYISQNQRQSFYVLYCVTFAILKVLNLMHANSLSR
jgi:hypothetical protein